MTNSLHRIYFNHFLKNNNIYIMILINIKKKLYPKSISKT